MLHLMEKVFASYGTDAVVVTPAGSQNTRVFCQSINSRSWVKTERSFSSLGEVPNRQYVCLLPAKTVIDAGDVIEIDGMSYLVRRVEDMHAPRGQVLYRWSLCVEKGREDTWGTNG